ncbi:MAG: restriction endonuclease subunit S [Bacteroidetes bacterium]|nr:restriction endonuclease subunit S [Bacteroidota bacterium]
MPNIAIFQERVERGHEDKELLSVTIGRGVIKQSELDKKDSSTLDKSKYLLVYPGDLVYSMRFRQGASGCSLYKGIVSPACTVLRPKKGIELNPRFFYYMFRTGFYKNYVERFAYGIADGQIPLRYVDFKRMYSIVPPLETQNAIVAYLDRKTQQIQEFIAKKERLIELLEEQLNKIIFSLIIESADCKQTKKNTNSAFQSLVPENWQEHRIKFLCSKPVTGQWGEDSKGNKNDIVCIRIADFNKLELITEGHTIRNIIPNDRLLLRENDLLIEKSGGGDKTPVGRVVKFSLPIKAITSNFISKISAKENIILSDYLLQIFNCLNIVRYNILSIKQTTGIQNLDMNHYLSNKIYIPSIENQKIILEKINNLTRSNDNLIQKAYSEIEKAKEYQESLITQIVTGQLKVPENAKANLG